MLTTTRTDDIPQISLDDLATVSGGFDVGGIASSIGGLVDQFAGTGGKATEAAGRIGGLVQSFLGGGGG